MSVQCVGYVASIEFGEQLSGLFVLYTLYRTQPVLGVCGAALRPVPIPITPGTMPVQSFWAV